MPKLHRSFAIFGAAALALFFSSSICRSQTFVGQNFTASSRPTDSSFIPPDTMGAVGINHFVELINGRYSVYRKSDGVRVQTATLNDFWATAGAPHAGSFAFDPRVLYDPYVKRWYALSVDNARGPNSFMLAISNSSDPTAGWKGFKIDADSDDTHWADFPMLGHNGQAIVLAANMFPIVSGPQNQTFVVIPKSDLLGPVPTVAGATKFEAITGAGFSVQPAVDLDDNLLPLPLLSAFNSTTTKRSSISGSPQAPTITTAGGSVAVPSYSSAPNADQPGPKANIHAGDTRFSGNVVNNNGELWAAHTVNAGGRAAIRWYRINSLTDTLIESGTISDPSLAFFYPSIAVNDLGDVVMGFSGTDPNTFVSTYAVTGITVGGATSFAAPFQTKAGVSDYQRLDTSNRNRWGDYSATTVDPADPSIFWTIQEYVSATDQWSTQATEIIVPQPGEVRWKNPSSGNFSTPTAWFGGAAPTTLDHVIFSRATSPASGSYTVTLDSDLTTDRLSVRQGRVRLDLAGHTWTATNTTIDAASLIVGEFAGTPELIIANGSFNNGNTLLARRAFSAATVTLQNATWISQGNLWLGGDPSSSGGSAILNVGPGSSLSIAGTTKVRSGGVLNIDASLVSVGSLDMGGGRVNLSPGGDKILLSGTLFMGPNGGTIELRDNAWIADYFGNDPTERIRDRIREAYSGGAWTGAGITSADADATDYGIGYAHASELFTSFPAMFLGQVVDATSVLVRFTRYGDSSLDGLVSLPDFNRLAANFGASGSFWHWGDFNYDGLVNLQDFNLLAANFGLSAGPEGPTPEDWSALAAAIPEPGGLALLAAGLWGMLKRRRRLG